MESNAKIAGHPAHPILIVFPLGLLATSVIFDGVYLYTGTAAFALVSYWMLFSGLVGGFVAAIPGLIDWFAIPKGTRARRVGLIHGLGNVLVMILFGVSWVFRNQATSPGHVPTMLALILSFTGFGLAVITGWLGGELVNRLGVGVDDTAHLNASSSLRGRLG